VINVDNTVKEKIKIELIEDFSGNGHTIFYVDAGKLDIDTAEELMNDIKMIIELCKKGNNNDGD